MEVNYICQNTIKPTDKAFYLTPSIDIHVQWCLNKELCHKFCMACFFFLH